MDASRLIHDRTGVTVPVSVVLAHFHAEGTGYKSLGGSGVGGYNLAGIQDKTGTATYATPQAFLREYVSTAAVDIAGAIRQKNLTPGSTLDQGQYAAALQYGGSGAYCQKKCGSFYQVNTVGGPLFGLGATANPTASGLTVPTGSAGLGSSESAAAAAGSGVKTTAKSVGSAASGLTGGVLGSVESWISGAAGRIGLVVLFAVLAVVVFLALVKSQMPNISVGV